MGFLKKIFRRRDNAGQKKASDFEDLGFAKFKTVKSSDSHEVVALKGIERSPEGALMATILENAYMESHPCGCGGQWVKQSGGSAYPVAYKDCLCDKCNAQKRFEFRFQ